MFFQVSLKIIAQAVIECEPAIHFPVVLEKERQGMVPGPHTGWNAVIAGIGRPDEKAGVIKSGIDRKRQALKRRKSRLVLTVEHVP